MREDFPAHATVNHSIGEYVRGEAHSNTVESYFAILKRGITGVYHHVSQQHLKRYLGEFDFRYNERMALEVTDAERAMKAVKGVVGKRVTYQRPNGRQAKDRVGLGRLISGGFLMSRPTRGSSFFNFSAISIDQNDHCWKKGKTPHLLQNGSRLPPGRPTITFISIQLQLTSPLEGEG